MKMFENSLRQSSKRGVSVKSVRLNLEQKLKGLFKKPNHYLFLKNGKK